MVPNPEMKHEKNQRCGTFLVGKVDNMMFNQIIGSIDAVFTHFSQTSGVPAERLGHAMRVLGMNPTQNADLWQQLVLDSVPRHCLVSVVAVAF